MMNHERLFHSLDTIIASVTTLVTAAATAVLGMLRPYDPADALWQTVLPLIGAVITSTGAVLLNPQTETRRIVIGRATFGLFAGVIAPSIIIAVLPNVTPGSWGWIVEVLRWPGALIGVGGVCAMAAYILSRPFCASAYERAGAVAAEQIKRIESLARGPNNTVVVLDPSRISPAPDPEKPRP